MWIATGSRARVMRARARSFRGRALDRSASPSCSRRSEPFLRELLAFVRREHDGSGGASGSRIATASSSIARYLDGVSDALTLTAVFTPDEDGWTMAQLAEWPAVVTCGRSLEEAREMLIDAARQMIASYHDEGREPPIGGGHVAQVTIDVAAA